MQQVFMANVPSYQTNDTSRELSDEEIRDTLKQAVDGMVKKLNTMAEDLTKFNERDRQLKADIAELQAKQGSESVANHRQADFYDTLPD